MEKILKMKWAATDKRSRWQRRELVSPTGRQNTSKPISEAKKHSIEEGLDSVTD